MEFCKISGKNILVTGSTSGIGLEIAKNCSFAGANVFFTGRSIKKLEDLKLNLGTRNKYIQADLNEDIDKIVLEIEPLDGLVLSAGIIDYFNSRNVDEKKIKKIFDTNFFSILKLISSISKEKKFRKGGSIVFLSSLSCKLGVYGTLGYASSKGALESAMRVYANEFAKLNIRVNSIAPGMIKTPLMENNLISQENIETEERKYPLGVGTPKDVADMARFLLSDESRWITGQSIIMDGGYTLN
jgi:NAD(P)-dependent dehydrogenase (short-subunit alcohol dehydrogenase family)